MSFGQGRFCEHEEEDISGEFDVWLIVVEWLSLTLLLLLFWHAEGPPVLQKAPEKCLLSPSGPSQDICGTQNREGS